MTVTDHRSTALITRPSVVRAPGVRATNPRWLVEDFRPRAAVMAQAILHEVRQSAVEYAEMFTGPFGELITAAIRESVRYALDKVSGRPTTKDRYATVFRQLGELEFAEGHDLNVLQTAYRIAGRVAWRHVAEFGQERGVPADVMCDCAQAIFLFVEEISALSIDGHGSAASQESGTMARRRRHLLEQILADPPVSPRELTNLADAARWQLPKRIVLIAIEPGDQQLDPAIMSLDGAVLVDLDSDRPCVLTAEPDETLAALEPLLDGRRVAVGPEVRLSDAAMSLRRARQTMALLQREVLPDAPVTRWNEHLLTLRLLSERSLLSALASRSLEPFETLGAKPRARLAETLLAWLSSRNGAPELALKLGVHPQTVRYRMRQLEQLFGDRLSDPDERLNLQIALRAEQLAHASSGPRLPH
jgi:hypothetical protein